MNSENETTEVLTVDEAAAFLKVSTRTVRRRIAEGALVAYEVAGNNVRLRRTDLLQSFVPMAVRTSPGGPGRRGRPGKVQAATPTDEGVAS